jgi:transposase
MSSSTSPLEYQTVVVGAAYLVKGIMKRLGVMETIDDSLERQPNIEATLRQAQGRLYGTLAQMVIVNRMSFDPQPIYHLGEWAQRHGMDRVFKIDPAWLDDDRLGAMLESVADQQVSIWSAIVNNAIERFKLEPEWLHQDTTSIYFEGAYEDDNGRPKGGQQGVPMLVEGYNKDGKRNKVQFVLSLTTSGRVPLWYNPYNGNQTDDGVYLKDLCALRKTVLVPDNAVLIGDRKLCNEQTMLSFCRRGQQFLAAHPWTDKAKAVWLSTSMQLEAGTLSWQEVDYASRNDATKAPQKRPRHLVCEVSHELVDAGEAYPLRWVFCWTSKKAQQDAKERAKALKAGEDELRRTAALIGKYDYTTPKTIAARIDKALKKARASQYFSYELLGKKEGQVQALFWERREDAIAQDERFDGVALLCANVPRERLSAAEAMVKYKEQVNVEQTIDFIKSPVQIRPMWLHSPKRLMGLTLLIMIAVLVAALLEHQVRRWIAKTGELVRGLMPEKRDNPYPTAKAMLRAFSDYSLVVVRGDDRQEVHCPKLRPVQQQIWDILGLDPLPV